jgi:hypothetical protein
MIKKFPEPYKTGVCLLSPNLIIPYIITPDGKGVCYWAKDGGFREAEFRKAEVAKFGNVCSDFEEEQNNCIVSKTKEDSD